MCVCVGLCIHPEHMAWCQTQADNILKETLQCCILTSNYSNVYSNQCHNRWRGTNLWQTSKSCSSFSCGFWCLMTASREELTQPSVSHIKKGFVCSRERSVNVLKCMFSYYWWVLCKKKKKQTAIIDLIHNSLWKVSLKLHLTTNYLLLLLLLHITFLSLLLFPYSLIFLWDLSNRLRVSNFTEVSHKN